MRFRWLEFGRTIAIVAAFLTVGCASSEQTTATDTVSPAAEPTGNDAEEEPLSYDEAVAHLRDRNRPSPDQYSLPTMDQVLNTVRRGGDLSPRQKFVLFADTLPEFDIRQATVDENGLTVPVSAAWGSYSQGRKWDAIGSAWRLLRKSGIEPAVVTVLNRQGQPIYRIDGYEGPLPPRDWNPDTPLEAAAAETRR